MAAVGKAFFIDPEGQVLPVRTSHIAAVIGDPKRFGTTKRRIEEAYRKQGEPVGLEGNARTEILVEVIERGWIRIREYPDRYWSVQFDTASPRTKGFVRVWARRMLKSRNTDPYLPVHLVGFSDGFDRRVELRTLATSAVFEVKGYLG